MIDGKREPNNRLRNIFKNASTLFTGNIVSNALTILSLSIFTKSQGPEIFGYYILCMAFFEITEKIFAFQTWQAFIKYATDLITNSKGSTIASLLRLCVIVDTLSLLIAALIAYILSGYFFTYFGIPSDIQDSLTPLLLLMLFKCGDVSIGIFRIYGKFQLQAKIVVIVALVKVIFFSMAAFFDGGLNLFVSALILSHLIGLSLTLVNAIRILAHDGISIKKIFLSRGSDFSFHENGVFSFIFYNNLDVAVRMVSRQLDVVILGRLYGAEVVGVYKIAKELASVVAKVVDPLYQAIYPELSKLLALNKITEAKDVAIRISCYSTFAAIALYLVFYWLGDTIIPIVFGVQFSDAYSIALVYLVALLIAIANLPLVPLIHSRGLAKEAFLNQISATLIYCIVIYPLILTWSSIGAASAYIIFYVSWAFFALKTIIKKKVV